MFFFINTAALSILRILDAGRFIGGHLTVFFGAALNAADMALTSPKFLGFFMRQFATFYALMDAGALQTLATVPSAGKGWEGHGQS
jgi:hypothetical protein